ncbi:ATP-binding protein [Kribbella albertanoniae]|uniref:ATP-binding protein n=1 Tax=Kribbella albertanoniae TaxID=1266829 RepID=A0A4R4Q7D1_9ACTN|nr:ATP-binding protein [Kribbella albertanoniae]
MSGFVGRRVELGVLEELLTAVRDGGRVGRPGRAVSVRGRRRVGKSRLVEEFLERADVPHVYFTAVGGSAASDLSGFAHEVAVSSLPGAAQAEGFAEPQTWDAAFGLLAAALPADRPSVVVIDELPYLIREDETVEGALQKAFDRTLSKLPVLLILVGSDIAMMERLNTYGRPFYQRGTELVVPPLSPADVASMLDLAPADAFDAFLVSGGLPLILEEWPRGADVWGYLEHALRRPTSALLVSGERVLSAEFPTEVQAQRVLQTIGSGERTFSSIGRAAGGLQATSLQRALGELTSRRVVAAERPLSATPSKETRYWVDDPYLRFWLGFVGAAIPTIERGRGDLVLETVRRGWTSWRGRAIEPVIRESLWRIADDRLPQGTQVISAYWTRSNDPEIDIVGADRSPVADKITMVGSIKWLERKPFDARDLASLIKHRAQLPGATDDTPLIAVSRSGCTAKGVQAFTPEDLIAAWR